jgi:hypothetical protein
VVKDDAAVPVHVVWSVRRCAIIVPTSVRTAPAVVLTCAAAVCTSALST